MSTIKIDQNPYPYDAKKVFRKMGTCSRTFFYLLNRHFGQLRDTEERASDTLAGGLMSKGYECGMLWGTSLAIGAEAYRRCSHLSQACIVSVEATKLVMHSFIERENTSQCREITRCDFTSKLSFARYMASGRFLHCFDLAEQWAPEAISNAMKGLADKPHDFQRSLSCSAEVAKRMGATEEQMVMVAGFAGGLGLSGGACGALAAAIWMKAYRWCQENTSGKVTHDPKVKELMNSFVSDNHDKILCREISGQRFHSVQEHTAYLKNGGCKELIEQLGRS
jgi:hypothetical protein